MRALGMTAAATVLVAAIGCSSGDEPTPAEYAMAICQDFVERDIAVGDFPPFDEQEADEVDDGQWVVVAEVEADRRIGYTCTVRQIESDPAGDWELVNLATR